MILLRDMPDEIELKLRIEKHLKWRNSDSTVILWLGYISSLLEWGLISVDCYDRLLDVLPQGIGVDEATELMLGVPDEI